jgi:glutathione S-transferase
MTEYRLHCFAQSGNSYKAALMLQLAGADWEPVFVDFFNGAHRNPEFLALNPMGEVPVLEHDGLVLAQSGVILDYLAGKTEKFGPLDEAERREILRWTLWDNHKLTRGTAALGVLEAHLGERDWVVGGRPTIADITCCGYLFFADEFPIEWEHDYPAIFAWLDRIAALPGWKHPYELMPGHPIPGKV